MRKGIKCMLLCLLLAVSGWTGSVIADRQMLNRGLIRMHIIANSDSGEDQEMKLRVRDAVLESLERDLKNVSDVSQAKTYLQENLDKISRIANEVLVNAGAEGNASATLSREYFDKRIYGTFQLPAGVYEALRVTIGEGDGRNWWCVAFPALCMNASGEDFAEVTAGAGFSDELSGALRGTSGHQIRFYFLDFLGKAENILFSK